MQAAFATWQHRISAVFDVTRQIHLVRVDGGAIVEEKEAPLVGQLPLQKALELTELGVDVLICGAISIPLHQAVQGYGIRVVPFVAGDLKAVLSAWLSGEAGLERFVMPGCRGGGHWLK